MENKVTFRNAERKDTGLILQFVKELAAYEDMSDDCRRKYPGDMDF